MNNVQFNHLTMQQGENICDAAMTTTEGPRFRRSVAWYICSPNDAIFQDPGEFLRRNFDVNWWRFRGLLQYDFGLDFDSGYSPDILCCGHVFNISFISFIAWGGLTFRTFLILALIP